MKRRQGHVILSVASTFQAEVKGGVDHVGTRARSLLDRFHVILLNGC